MGSKVKYQVGDQVVVMGAYETIVAVLDLDVYMIDANGTHYAQRYELANGETIAVPEA